MYLLIVYDIADDKRRYRVEKVLSSYGKRVNYSVFEVETDMIKYRNLVTQLEENSSKKEDNIRIYILGKESLKKSFVLHTKERIFSYETLYL